MILITQSALLAESGDYPFTNARIGYDTITRTGTLTASSETALHPAYAAGLPNTYDSWIPASIPAHIDCDAGAVASVDYIGIAAHTLGSSGCTFKLQYSADGITYSDATPNMTVPNDTPIMVFFAEASARYWRLDISAGSAPIIGTWYAGKSLAMQRAIYGGHSPITLSRQTVIRSNKSEGGHFLGRYIVRSGVSTSAQFKNLTADWYRTYFDPFVLAARTMPFFFAWRPLEYPAEVAYAWTAGDIVPQNMGVRDLMSVSIDMQGVGNYE